MSSRTAALVRDIAALFAKYRLDDWKPVIDELEAGGRASIATAIRLLAEESPARKTPRRTKATKPRRPARPPELAFRPDRSEVLTRLQSELVSKELLRSIGHLRLAFAAVGLKESSPARREDMVRALLTHLNTVPDDRFEPALRAVASEAEKVAPGTDYERWFELIGRGTRRH